ncbi:MAG: chitobiase/beta-hexosaminidase C-terminal domain-containing protein, partial [Myxococcales bacterium]|nr:chitobiase/beta-hexosaminidase C-terminal domain-containing protein [Myxococcales bacterium]
MRRAPFLLFAAVLAGCPEEVPPPGDTTPPGISVFGVTPTGSRVEVVDGVLLVPTAELSVHVEADEAATVFYTTDGAEPGRGTGGLARNAAVLPLVNDTRVRWVAEDLAGNLGEPGEVEVRFDREAPVVDIDPAGGDFPGPIEVLVTVSEPVTVWWTTDGVAPVVGGDRGETAEAGPDDPIRIPLARDTTLRLLAIDVAGNSFTQPALVYTIDDRPPETRATPPEGHYVGPVSVALSTDEAGATIRYTLDGTAPGPDSAEYVGPLAIARPTMLRFRATDAGGNVEEVRAADYTIGPRGAAEPRVEPAALGFPVEGGLWLAAALLDGAG